MANKNTKKRRNPLLDAMYKDGVYQLRQPLPEEIERLAADTVLRTAIADCTTTEKLLLAGMIPEVLRFLRTITKADTSDRAEGTRATNKES